MSHRSKRDTLYAAARARHRYPVKATGAAAAVTAAGTAAGILSGHPEISAWAGTVGGTGMVAGLPWWAARHVLPKGTVDGVLQEADFNVQKTNGTAGRLDVMQYASATAIRLKGRWVRPDTYGRHTDWQLRRTDPTEFGVQLLENGQGWGWFGEQVWASVEDTTLRIGGPRTYKTLSLACHGLDAKGAVVTTSTRLDLAEWLHAVRAVRKVSKPAGVGTDPADYSVTVEEKEHELELDSGRKLHGNVTYRAACAEIGCRWETPWSVTRRPAERQAARHRVMHARRAWVYVDRPVHFFNPAAYVDVESTVRWSILIGCEEFKTARRRAADLLPETPDADGERWDRQARRILSLFLHAAAVGKKADGSPYRATDVLRWAGISKKDDPAVLEVIDALNRSGPGGSIRAGEARAHWHNNEKTLTSITTTMMPALSWLSDDKARELGDADRETITLNVARLIEEGETLHLIGHEDQSGLAPLIACVVSEIAHQARQIAGHRPGQRLDPPLTFLLDEAALVCPVPLDRWTADMGGRGVTIHVSVQSLAQLRQRWGKEGSGTILGNIGWLLAFGGNKNADDLADLSVLAGEREQKAIDPDVQAEKKRWVPVMTPAEISRMEAGKALCLPRGMPSLVGYAPLVKDRPDGVRTTLAGRVPAPQDGVALALPAQTTQEVTAEES